MSNIDGRNENGKSTKTYRRTDPPLLRLGVFCFALFITGAYGGSGKNPKGLRPSDPQLTGPRDTNYDHVIVPGERIGPVRLGGLVSDAVKHLGNPDSVYHNGSPTYSVEYAYKEGCLHFRWIDSGAEPVIDGVVWVRCGTFSTSEGLQVGSSMQDVIGRVAKYCSRSDGNGYLEIQIDGLSFGFVHRNSTVDQITVEKKTGKLGSCD